MNYLTTKVMNNLMEIAELFAKIPEADYESSNVVKLRKQNKIKSVHASCAIENNSLTQEEIKSILNGKAVIGSAMEIQEVENALKLYDLMDSFNPFNEKDFLQAHYILTSGLIEWSGKYREVLVGIQGGGKIKYIAPNPSEVPRLMSELFNYLNNSEDNLVAKGIYAHYQIETIHPFVDGNGRIGRFWQTLVMKEFHPVAKIIPVETLIYDFQKEYYNALNSSQNNNNPTMFFEFMSDIFLQAIKDFATSSDYTVPSNSYLNRMQKAKSILGHEKFSKSDYSRLNKEISSTTASRDLADGVNKGDLVKMGEKNTTTYKFVG